MSNEQNTQAGANFLTSDQIAAGAAIECDHVAPIGRNVAIDVFDAMRAAAPVAGVAAAPIVDLSALTRWDAEMYLRGPMKVPDVRMGEYTSGRFFLADDVAAHLAGATPVAAQAGQVAVPEGWKLVPVKVTDLMREAGRVEADRRDCDADRSDVEMIFEVMADAAPSAPAVAQQAPAADALDAARYRWLCQHGHERMPEAVLEAMDAAHYEGEPMPKDLIDQVIDKERAQASTPDVRQEGGDHG